MYLRLMYFFERRSASIDWWQSHASAQPVGAGLVPSRAQSAGLGCFAEWKISRFCRSTVPHPSGQLWLLWIASVEGVKAGTQLAHSCILELVESFVQFTHGLM